jgi:peptidoglycan/LPS O-acetylase OafA/YrhL
VRRSRAVDALRAVAVLLVLLHHVDIGPLVAGRPWLAPLREVHEAGYLGVSLFLVLSGFSIHLRVAGGGEFRTGAFLRRRFLRLHPTYYVAMCFAGLVALVSALGGHPWRWPNWGLAEGGIPGWVLVIVHVSVLAGTIIPPGWLMVTWSLALEEQIYLVYAALVRRLRRVEPWRWLLLGIAASLAFRLACELVLPSVPKNFPPGQGHTSWVASLAFQQAPARLAEWLTGALVAEWYAGAQRLPRLVTGRLLGPLTAATGLVLVWTMFEHRGGWDSVNGHRYAATDVLFDPVAGLVFGALLASCLASERRGRTRGATNVLAWVGERSYSLYLVHAPILGTTFALAGGLIEPAAGRVAVACFAISLSLLCAAALYRYVEAPCTAWSKRAGGKRAPDDQRSAAGNSDQRYAAASAPL